MSINITIFLRKYVYILICKMYVIRMRSLKPTVRCVYDLLRRALRRCKYYCFSYESTSGWKTNLCKQGRYFFSKYILNNSHKDQKDSIHPQRVKRNHKPTVTASQTITATVTPLYISMSHGVQAGGTRCRAEWGDGMAVTLTDVSILLKVTQQCWLCM